MKGYNLPDDVSPNDESAPWNKGEIQFCEECGQEEGKWSFNFYLCDECRMKAEEKEEEA